MSSDLLNRAADRLEELATVASTWLMEDGERRALSWHTASELSDISGFEDAHAAYIAAMSPPVALALANVLRANCKWDGGPDTAGPLSVALADLQATVARAVLSEAS